MDSAYFLESFLTMSHSKGAMSVETAAEVRFLVQTIARVSPSMTSDAEKSSSTPSACLTRASVVMLWSCSARFSSVAISSMALTALEPREYIMPTISQMPK